MRLSSALAASALAAGASASNYLGFNSGATKADRSAKFKADFEAEFRTAQNLKGAPGKFNAVRLYTNIQAYSQDDPIEAFDAAIDTDTSILLGMWTSGTDSIEKEIAALKKAVNKHGSKLTDRCIGISIGSEDLYRDSVTGVKNKAGVGNSPQALVRFINDFRKAFKDTPLGKIPVGHVDTWDVWPNATNKPVLDAIDFIGVDEYPFYEDGKGNDIKNAPALFEKAYQATLAAANGKPVWVTETGWPATGPDWDQAVASVENAKYYWDQVGCRKLFGKTPTFWYTLRDSNPDNKVKFAITDNLSTTPKFDLSCSANSDKSRSTGSATSMATPLSTSDSGSGSGSSDSGKGAGSGGKYGNSTGNGSGSGSGSSSGSDSGSSSGGSSGNGSSGSGSGSGSGAGAGSGSGSGSPAPSTVVTAGAVVIQKLSATAFAGILVGALALL